MIGSEGVDVKPLIEIDRFPNQLKIREVEPKKNDK